MKSLYHQSQRIEGMNLRIVVLVAAIAVPAASGLTEDGDGGRGDGCGRRDTGGQGGRAGFDLKGGKRLPVGR
jgi:hypothetical protein